jgi:LmbE family N-acetylglucosaminyl deacetylase
MVQLSCILLFPTHTIPIPTPTFVIDVTDVIEDKLKVLQAYESQFKDSPLKKIIEVTLAKMRFWGSLIGKDYGEGIFSRIPLPITFDPSSCILNFFY